MPVTAIIPVKALAGAKGRLSGALAPAQRRELATWMFTRVFEACTGCPAVADVVVVAGDEEAAALAPGNDCTVVVERRSGLDLAVDRGTALVPKGHAALVVAADLPLADAGAVAAVCSAGDGAPVVVVPTRDGGTGALLRRPATVIPTAFGAGSSRAHLGLAARAGVAALLLDVPQLALDVDTSEDLAEARARHGHLDAWLRASGSVGGPGSS